MTVRLDQGADESTARWLCHGCGATYPVGGPAYPICARCGRRCLAVDADGLPFVGAPSMRLQAAEAEHANAYRGWRGHLDSLRCDLDEWRRVDDAPGARREPSPRLGRDWQLLAAAAAYVNHTAEHVDRVEADVARLTGPSITRSLMEAAT